ncbi:MAG: hypothetical protein KJS90_10175 [Acidobacteria bacterium]|nr:hypothetical protein [Acidobacteriota bacterium]
MTTTYSVILAASSWNDEVRDGVVGLVDGWSEQLAPGGRLPANASLRTLRPVGSGDRDPVYRIQYSETFAREGIGRTTVVTVLPVRGALTLEARVVESALRSLVEPLRSRPALPRPELLELVARAADTMTTYDAERRVGAAPQRVAGFVDGQALAALALAPSRRLPIIVDVVTGRATGSERSAGVARALVGLAHVAHLADDDAIRGFNDLWGSALVTTAYPLILWPGSHAPKELSANARGSDFVAPVLAAATFVPPLVVPPPPREPRPEPAPQTRSAPAPSVPTPTAALPAPGTAPRPDEDDSRVVAAELQRTVDHLRARHDEDRQHIDILDEILEQVESERDELFDRVSERDEDIERKDLEIDQLRKKVDLLISRNVEYEIYRESQPASIVVASVADAIAIAARRCTNLGFAKEAFETAEDLEGPDPKMLLFDLVRLNGVVADWRAHKVSFRGLESWAKGTAGLDYVPSIGESTAQKHADYYLATWHGEFVPLRAHLRRGRGTRLIRVYLYVDDATKSIVVGKVDRHGPDRTT